MTALPRAKISDTDGDQDGLSSLRSNEEDANSAINILRATHEQSDFPNPLDWPKRRKWKVKLTLSAMSFVSILSSSVAAPALPQIASDLDMDPVEGQIALSVYVIGLTFSPLVLAPTSEMIGRVPVVNASNIWFLLWIIVTGFAKNKSPLIAARYLSGMRASLVYAIGAGVLGDCWRREQRGGSLGIYASIPLLGTAVGPSIGGIIAQNLDWRWIFYIVGIFQTFISMACFFAFEETYYPVLLKRQAKKQGRPESRPARQQGFSNVAISLLRPLRLLATNPPLQLITLYDVSVP